MITNPDPRLQPVAKRLGNDPIVPERVNPRRWVAIAAIMAGALGGAAVMSTGGAHAAWQEMAQLLSLQGKPEPASANVLSEHETDNLDRMSPQSQARLLLERSVNHYQGANDEIVQRVSGWRGKIKVEGPLNAIFMTALNSDDLRVRAAALEIDLAARNVEKDAAAVDRMEQDARSGDQAFRVNALWSIALLGNRGVEPGRASEILQASLHDPNVNIRYWAVEGQAYLGTDETVALLLQTFHDDPSPMIRERAACGLAQSGMLSKKQRRSAVPQLLNFGDDPSLDPSTREWVFHALRDITGQTLPHDAAAWRSWYNSNDGQWAPVTRDSQ